MKKTLLWMIVIIQLVIALLGGCSRDESLSVDDSVAGDSEASSIVTSVINNKTTTVNESINVNSVSDKITGETEESSIDNSKDDSVAGDSEASSIVTSVINNKTTTVNESINVNSVSDKITGETEESSIDNSKMDMPTTSLTDMTQETTDTTTTTIATGIGTVMPPWKYSIQRVPTVDDLLNWVRITDVKDYGGQYDTLLTRVRERGVCVPMYKGKRLDSDNFERGVSLLFEMKAEAPGFYYYYPGGIVRCYYIEDGLADKAKEQLVSFRHGKNSTAAAKEADSKLDVKSENLILSDNRKVECASYQEDDRRMATFLLNENILITVDVFHRYQLSPKEVISDLSFEIIDV